MEHEEVDALIPAYALGATDTAEQAEVERHLAGCPACQARLAEYRDLSDGLLYTAPLLPAPAHLGADLAQRIGSGAATRAERGSRPQIPARPGLAPNLPRWRWPSLALGGLALAIVLLFATNLYWWNQNRGMQSELAAHATAVAVLAQSPIEVALSAEAAVPQARGNFYFDPHSNLGVLRIAGLPPVPGGKTYQVWLIHGTQRQSGGLFTMAPSSATLVMVHAPNALEEYEALGITLEPAGGSPGPTSPRLIGAKF